MNSNLGHSANMAWRRVFIRPAHLERGGEADAQRGRIWTGIITGLLLGMILLSGAACEKKAKSPTTSVGLATQGGTSEAASTYADANLADLTRELRRWIVKTKQRPASFEEFAAKSQIQIPPAPAGKKYVISKEMRVVLADR